MRIALIDTYYPEFLRTLPFDPKSSYERELAAVLSHSFGTADFFSRNLRALGHECIDIIASHGPLQGMWMMENYPKDMDRRGDWILGLQIENFQPDVLFLQDLNVHWMSRHKSQIVAAQCSCPWPNDANIKRCDVAFTSFPHYAKRFEDLGVRGIYMPLAFEPRMLEGPQPERDIDISFVGGVGAASHWKYGTDVLEAVAAAFPTRFQWWGYGLDNLPASSALRACYRGSAWGKAQYEIYRRSRVVVNRHGEVAQGYTNNLRCMEATGCGAMLLTEASPNLLELFPYGTAVPYESASDLRLKLSWYLENDERRAEIAAAGQAHTLANHTYAQRMKVVSDVLKEMLVAP